MAAPVREDRVAAPRVAAVEQAVRLEHLLRGERNQDRRGIGGQGTGHGQRVGTQGQFRGQSLELHEFEAFGLAGLGVDLGAYVPACEFQLLLACRAHADHDDRVHETLVGLAQFVPQLAELFLLVREIVGQVVGVESLLAVLAPLVHDLHLDLGVLAAHAGHAVAAVHGSEMDAHVDAGAQAGQVVDQLVGQFRRQGRHPHGAVKERGVHGFDVEPVGFPRVDAPRAYEVLRVGLSGLVGETTFIEREGFSRPQHLGHEPKPVGAVEACGGAFVDVAQLGHEVVAQRVQRGAGGLPVVLRDGHGHDLDRARVAADRLQLAFGEPVVVPTVLVEPVAALVHHHVGQDLANAAAARVGGDLHALAGVEAVDHPGPLVDDLHLVRFGRQLVVDVLEHDARAPLVAAKVGDAVAQHGIVADELFDALRLARRFPPAGVLRAGPVPGLHREHGHLCHLSLIDGLPVVLKGREGPSSV